MPLRFTFLAGLGAACLAFGVPARAQDPEAAAGGSHRPWDVVVGAVTAYSPEYQGAANHSLRVTPGFFLRWGRVSFASRGAFAVRSTDAGQRGGLRIELAEGDRFRAGLGLRLDSGRRESSSPDLRGMGDIDSTLRLRLSTSYRLDDGWRLGAAASLDAFGRGGGWLGDASVSRDHTIDEQTRWGWAASVGFAGDRYLQTYFGVTPEQSAASGYPVYTPSTGLRDLSLSISARHELTREWFVFGGASVSRLVGPAASSPLTRDVNGWGLNLGLAYRF